MRTLSGCQPSFASSLNLFIMGTRWRAERGAHFLGRVDAGYLYRGLCSKSCATGNHVLLRPLANREPDVTNGGTRTPGNRPLPRELPSQSHPNITRLSPHPTRSTRRPERFKPTRVSSLHASRFNMTAANTDTELLTEHFGYPPVVSHPPISDTRPLTVSNPDEKLTQHTHSRSSTRSSTASTSSPSAPSPASSRHCSMHPHSTSASGSPQMQPQIQNQKGRASSSRRQRMHNWTCHPRRSRSGRTMRSPAARTSSRRCCARPSTATSTSSSCT